MNLNIPLLRSSFTMLLALLLCTLYGRAQTASFTVDNNTGCTPLVVHFTNTSSGATSYSWNLGNSTTTSLTDPSGSYITPGTYTVTLTAYNGSSTSTATTVITVYPLPTVSFSALDTTLCPGFPATFLNTSTPNTSGPATYTWNFGDGSTSVAPAPSYVHPSPGYYDITLFVTNSMGCFKSLTKTSYIRVYDPPMVSFSGSGTYICTPPAPVAFVNTTSGVLPLSYNWNFGDGSPSTVAPSPTHVYSAQGSYNVRLKATDGNGCVDSSYVPGYVYVSSLTATYSAPTVVCRASSLDFVNTSTDHTTRMWYFGDGNTATDVDVSYTYTVAGTYNPMLVISDGTCADTATSSITVNPTPSATFTINPTIPCPTPTSVTYNATISPGSIATWRMLDDSAKTGATVVKPYKPDTYGTRADTIFLDVTNSFGCSTHLQRLDTNFNAVLSINSPALAGCIPLSTSFSASLSASTFNPVTNEGMNVISPYIISSYVWNFGDGSPTSSSPTPSHTYTAVGVYNVICSITTSTGCVITKSQSLRCGVPPVISFTATPTQICAGKGLNLTTSGSPTLNSYLWDYGDGQSDSGSAFSAVYHVYIRPGFDTIALKGYHNGCPSPVVKSVVTIDSPGAVAYTTYLCTPNNGIAFGDSSLGADSHIWLFGDGTTSTLHNVVHYYDTLQNYTVRLATYNAASGCRDTALIGALLARPGMDINTTDRTVCTNDSVIFVPTFLAEGVGVTDTRFYRDWTLVGSVYGTIGNSPPVPMLTPGYHDIQVVFTDGRGCQDTFQAPHYMLAGHPTDSFTFVSPVGCAPFTETFINHSTGIPEVPLSSYTWTFGDGSPAYISTSPAASKLYPAPGNYTVTLTVEDTIGCTSTTDVPMVVQVFRPQALFYADFNNVCMGTNVHFNNLSTGITSSFWMFGDGGTSTATSPNHLYAASGVYTVKLAVTDAHGCSDTATLLNYIYVAPSPHASFTMSDSFAVCPPLNVHFTNSSTSAVSYLWSFGTGATSVATNPSSPYSISGYYTVQLVARNSIGCTDTARSHVNIFGYNGAFSYLPHSGCQPLPVHFSASLGSFASLVWDFGDGFTSVAAMTDTISHTYSAIGSFVPKLILTDTTGCTNVSIGIDTIRVENITPHFRITPNPVCQGSTTLFVDSSYATYSSPVNWAWAFGSGATSTSSSPVYTFTTSGTQTVSLTVTSGYGCTGSVTRTVTVNAIPDTIAGNRTVCVGYTTVLSNVSPFGSWSTSAPAIATVSSVGVVSGVSPGTARITYTLSAGCIATAVVTVYSVPAPISGITPICQHAVTTYSTSTTGGTWSSSLPSVASVTPTSGFVTGVGGGSAIISYTLGSGCYVTKAITINQTPLPITGTAAVCIGQVTTLSEPLSGGTWTSATAAVGTVDASGNVAGISAGTTIITYAFATGCLTSRVVTVNSLPDTISGTFAICYGGFGVLADASPGGTWSSLNPTIAFVHPVSGAVLGMNVGTAIIEYSLGTGCKASKQITINPVPGAITGTARTCEGTTTMLFQSLAGGSWSSSDATVATIDASGLVTGVNDGTATITYAFGTGCLTTRVVTIDPLPDTIVGDVQLCYGELSWFTNSLPGGTWTSTNPVSVPISITGLATALGYGSSTIVYTLPTGCSRSVDVSVNPIPAPITGANNVCVAIPTVLSSATPGGTWSSGDITVATIDMFTGVYNGVSAGTANITYTSAAGCETHTTVTVQALPPDIGGGPTVCAGFAVNLTNSMPGGTWSSDPAASMVGTIHPLTGVVTGITPGTVSVTYTVMTGCQRNLVVTVLVLPDVIGGAPNVCVGDSHYLTNSTPGGTWSSSNISRATIDPVSGALTGISAGPVVITYFVASGCFNVLTVMVNPKPAPISGPSAVCQGATIALASASPGGLWIPQYTDTATVSATGGVVTGVGAGKTLISYILPTGCSVTKLVTVHVAPPAITGNPHICTGSPVTYSNAMPGGWWISGSPSVAAIDPALGVATPLSLGTSLISYVMPATGCMATKVVTVHPLPTVYSVTGGGSYCAGGPGRHVGLSGSQAGVSYVLYYGASATGFDAGSGFPLDFGSLTPAGVYTVRATDVNSGCVRNMSGSASISVTPLITPSVNVFATPSDTVCPGQFVGLSVLPYGGGTSPRYYWRVNGTLVDSASAYVFYPADGDSVSVSMISNATCLATPVGVGYRKLMVLPTATPVVNVLATPGDTVCKYSPAYFTAVPLYGGSSPSYKWRVNGLLSALGETMTYVPNDGDVVTCQMTSNYRCRLADSVVSGDVTMSVDSFTPPHVTLSADPGLTVAHGQPVTLHAWATHAGSSPAYQWRLNGILIPGATDVTYTHVFNHMDSIACDVTGNGVCAGLRSFAWAFITLRALSVDAPHIGDDLRLIPNPNNGDFSLSGTIAGVDGPVTLTVTDMLGQVIFRGEGKVVSGAIDERVHLTGDLANGMYILSVGGGEQSHGFHFVLKR
ncbi:MAG: PKD domain-containing protein [Taibaiella sp.]|nr:PKD domain-containing protein [Taibaiella sp.]